MINGELLDFINKYGGKPAPYEPGVRMVPKEKTEEPAQRLAFWDDPHISKSMLEAHLSPDTDAASRKPGMIAETVRHLFGSGLIKPGMRVLDLGCGPGLYSQLLSREGAVVTGIDMSQRSLDHARKCAVEAGLDIEYRKLDFFDIDYVDEFDAVMQVYGELNTFSDEKRDRLLKIVHRALKNDGVFIFDVTTRALRNWAGIRNGWHVYDGGFWRPGRHVVLEQGWDYPGIDVWLDQFIVVDEDGAAVYRNWFHDYDLGTIKAVLKNAGFEADCVWNDLTGREYAEGGDWIALGAKVCKS
ncbi:MAG TPA: methyltransferase domain-containing protein [Clostridia bacterium]|nr:methyltransferase domain-containing protein [Clostridia bacterium]